jgi:hypothetical protein
MDDWRPDRMELELDTQVAHDGVSVHFRFRWDQPNPGGWIHDMLVYLDGEWQNLAEPSPWESPEHDGFYEDRLSFLLDDGSVEGFGAFGGWLTAHEGMRSLPSAIPPERVRAHEHFGPDGLDVEDVRKYIPQSRTGEWWEGRWDAVRSPETLARLKREGVFLDLPMWRAHRSDPLGYGTDAHVLEYRHADAGRKSYTSQAWDREAGPEYMFDPAAVADGALDYHAVMSGEVPEQGADTYALTPDVTVPFDPDVAEWEGAMIPRRPLREPRGSAADWTASGDWADGEWTVTMSRRLRTDHPLDTTQLTPGSVYHWSPAIHHGAGKRWHWVGYPYRLGIGVEPEPGPDHPDPGPLIARERGSPVDWSTVPTRTLPMVFPGLQTWTDLTDDDHDRHEAVREPETTMWALHGRDGPAGPG